MKTLFTFLLCALAPLTSASFSAPPPLPERALKLTGDLLILPAANRAAIKKGEDAILRIPRGPAVTRGAEIWKWIESSDHMRHRQLIYKEGGRPQFHFSQI